MKKSLLLALAVLLLVFGGGLVAFKLLFEGNRGVQPASDHPEPPVTVPKQTADAALAQPSGIYAAEVQGTVERRALDSDWTALAKGDALNETDEVRSADDSSASIVIGEKMTIDLKDNTQFALMQISDLVANVRLDDGELAASTEGSALRIEVKNSDAVAETSDGQFSIVTESSGHVAVASKRGSVDLSAMGETVSIAEGQGAFVQADSAPSRPTEIPASLFLKVKRPRADKDLRTTVVSGRATPGAIVDLGAGVRVPVGADGTFKQQVPLVEGTKDLHVEVRDAAGRTQTVSVRVVTPATNTSGVVEW